MFCKKSRKKEIDLIDQYYLKEVETILSIEEMDTSQIIEAVVAEANMAVGITEASEAVDEAEVGTGEIETVEVDIEETEMVVVATNLEIITTIIMMTCLHQDITIEDE
jgi:hypothetical protein